MLNVLVLDSDVIVQGTIISVGRRTFRVRVSRTIAGNVGRTIDVEQFVDFIEASRWAPYASGQEVLLFLTRDGGRYRIGGLGESEMPIVAGVVYVSPAYRALAPAGADPDAVHAVYGGRTVGFGLDVNAFVDALVAARACFVPFVDGRGCWGPVPSQCGVAPRTPLERALFAAMPARAC